MGGTLDVIAQECKIKKVNLAVMGIVGEAGKIKEHIIGSTSVKVARHLDVPLFIIPDGVKYKRIHKLSFACDMDHTEENTTVYTANYFAKVFDAELEIISVENPFKERVQCFCGRGFNLRYPHKKHLKINCLRRSFGKNSACMA